MKRFHEVLAVFCLTSIFTVLSPLAAGQGRTTGEIHGAVRDPYGALIPGADVRAKDIATGVEKTATAAQDGAFVLLNLQAGTYQLTVTAAGFQTAVYPAVVVLT